MISCKQAYLDDWELLSIFPLIKYVVGLHHITLLDSEILVL